MEAESIKEIKEEIAGLKAKWPAHSVSSRHLRKWHSFTKRHYRKQLGHVLV